MADKETIKREILRIAGNPSAGAIKDLADEWASAIVALDEEPTKETRVMKVAEKALDRVCPCQVLHPFPGGGFSFFVNKLDLLCLVLYIRSVSKF
jgi:hypothetical protein